jgi:YD repeat-containing protein
MKMIIRHSYIFISIGLSALFVCLANFGASAETDKGNLLGSIRSVREESGTWEKGSQVLIETTSYDTKGNIVQTETAFYDVDGTTVIGRKLKSNYLYNDKGTLIKIESTWDDGSPASVEHIQDSGTKKVETVLDPDGSLKHKRTYFYERERKVKETLNDASGSIVSKVIYTYDKNGNLTQTISYKDDKSIDHRDVYAYDKNGNRIEVTTYRSDNSIDNKVTYTYDEKRHKTKSVIDKYKMDGSLNGKRVTLYNEREYLTETSTYNAEGSLQEKETHSYEFDSIGNWIKKTTLKWVIKDGKLSPETPHIIKRIITYY